jgi:Ca-activated chloride channel family protein
MPAGADPLALVPGDRLSGSELGSWDSLPELPFRPTSITPRGLDWPHVPGSNRQFLYDKGFHPFVAPLPGTALQGCAVPLAVEPASYELARRYLERSEMPPPDRVRTEDFLAALDYGFPKPSRGLGLAVAGGPSPISGEGFSLLQVGVQAWQDDATRHAPLRLVLLVDTSTSMRWGSRLEIVRRALVGLPELLGPDDRVSLVTFNQAGHVLVEDLGRERMSQFRAAAESLAAEGPTNFVDGLREALGVARGSFDPNRRAVRMVLLTDGLLDLDPAVAEKVQKDLAEAARQKIRLDAIDLGQQQKDADPQLAALSQAGKGGVHRAVSSEQVRWALREIVTGRSQLVARSARLHVTFNPEAVLEYRIIGHESGEWAGMMPGAVEADFREGQAATGLFELRLAPNGPNDVAKVELTWYSPDGNRSPGGTMAEKVDAVVRRGQFADSASTPAWFHQAAVAAYTAEVLRHSPFIFQRNPGEKVTVPAALRRANELASAVDRQAAQTPSYREFAELIHREIKAHPAKR